MGQSMRMTLGMALQIKKVCDNILYSKDENGNVVEKELPFRLKYRISKNMTYLDKYASAFIQNKLYFQANFGTENPETHAIELEETGAKQFTYALRELLNKEVTMNITTLDPSDIDLLTENTNVSYDDIRVFTAYMMDEQNFFDDINSKVNFNLSDILEEALKLQ